MDDEARYILDDPFLEQLGRLAAIRQIASTMPMKADEFLGRLAHLTSATDTSLVRLRKLMDLARQIRELS